MFQVDQFAVGACCCYVWPFHQLQVTCHLSHLLFGHLLTGPRYCLQPGTKEDSCKVVEMKEIDGSTLRRLVSFMYGQSPALWLASKQVMQLFVAADAHQVIESVTALL